MRAGAAGALLYAVLAFPTTASATPAYPFTQCPPVAADASCGTLIVVDEHGDLEAFNDSHVGHLGFDDALVGIQNESAAPVRSISITSTPHHEIYDFDGNGICGAFAGAPEGCPFGPTGYEGPAVEFDSTEELVKFAGEGLAPGASAYFSLEGISLEGLTQLTCGPQIEREGCHTLAPTTLATTLSGGGHSGAKGLSVPDGTSVTEQATLSGTDVSPADGTIEYDVYSDPQCTHEVTTAGTFPVSAGTIPPSNAETLAPGTYYWQATYSGDAIYAGTHSPCSSVVEFVKPECRAVAGVGHLGPRGPEGLTEANRLDVSGSPHRFTIASPGLRVHLQALTSAACVGWDEFRGTGPAKVNGAQGYVASFTVTVEEAGGGVFLTLSVEKEGKTVLSLDHERLNKGAKERFS